MKNRIVWGSMVFVLFTGSAATAAILDDFSTSNEENYDFVQVWNSSSDGWAVSGGQLTPTVGATENATGAWMWKGTTLAAVGDSVSIDFQISSADGISGFGTAAGLYFMDSVSSPMYQAEVSLLLKNSTLKLQTAGTGTTLSETAMTGLATLTVAMTGQTGSSSTYSVTLSGGGLTTTTTSFTFSSSTADFGIALYNNNTSGNVVFDNFSASVVPEPSAAGLALLGSLAVLLRRRSTIKK